MRADVDYADTTALLFDGETKFHHDTKTGAIYAYYISKIDYHFRRYVSLGHRFID